MPPLKKKKKETAFSEEISRANQRNRCKQRNQSQTQSWILIILLCYVQPMMNIY